MLKNKPYVKQYETQNGKSVLTNPIQGAYKSEHPNRQARRRALKKEPFMNFSKKGGTNLVVISRIKFIKWGQVINLVSGGIKRIFHTTHIQ
jgi:hypothetical protein